MTEKQRQLLRFIERFQANHDGVSPSFEEMRIDLRLPTRSGAHRLVLALEEQGRLRRSPRRSRGVTVIPEHIDLSGVTTEILLAELARRNAGAGATS